MHLEFPDNHNCVSQNDCLSTISNHAPKLFRLSFKAKNRSNHRLVPPVWLTDCCFVFYLYFYTTFTLCCRPDREGHEETIQHPRWEGNQALEPIHEQHLWASQQTWQHHPGRWPLSRTGRDLSGSNRNSHFVRKVSISVDIGVLQIRWADAVFVKILWAHFFFLLCLSPPRNHYLQRALEQMSAPHSVGWREGNCLSPSAASYFLLIHWFASSSLQLGSWLTYVFFKVCMWKGAVSWSWAILRSFLNSNQSFTKPSSDWQADFSGFCQSIGAESCVHQLVSQHFSLQRPQIAAFRSLCLSVAPGLNWK